MHESRSGVINDDFLVVIDISFKNTFSGNGVVSLGG